MNYNFLSVNYRRRPFSGAVRQSKVSCQRHDRSVP